MYPPGKERGSIAMLERMSWVVPEAEAGLRLDRFLRKRLPEIPSKSVSYNFV